MTAKPTFEEIWGKLSSGFQRLTDRDAAVRTLASTGVDQRGRDKKPILIVAIL